METWYAVEYNYSKIKSDKVFYKGRKEFTKFKDLQKFLGFICYLSDKKEKLNTTKQCYLFRKYFGQEGKFVSLRKVYKYSKKEIPVVSMQNNRQKAINM